MKAGQKIAREDATLIGTATGTGTENCHVRGKGAGSGLTIRSKEVTCLMGSTIGEDVEKDLGLGLVLVNAG